MGTVAGWMQTITGVLGLHPETGCTSVHGPLAAGNPLSSPSSPPRLAAEGREVKTDISIPMAWLLQSTADGNAQEYCYSHTGTG